MEGKSRVANSLKNLKVVWVWQIVYIFIKFPSRRVYTSAMPVEYLGAENVFTNIVGLLDMAEIGITVAVTSELYEPLVKNNKEKIKQIMSTFGKLYRVIAVIILIIGMVILPFITKISNDLCQVNYVHIIFLCYLLSTVFSYLFGYKSVLLAADQKNYIFVRNHYIYMIVQNILQIVSLLTAQSFLVYALIMVGTKCLEYYSLDRIANNLYPYLDTVRIKDKQVSHKIIANVKKNVAGKISNSIIQTTDSLLITGVIGLSVAGLYSNYSLIISSALAIVIQFPSSITASVGNMVNSSDEKKISQMFWIIFMANSSVFGLFSILIGVFIQPFISFWIGPDYKLPYEYVIIIILVFFITGVRSQIAAFKTARGLFQLETLRAIVECTTNLVLSIILARQMGIIGVSAGTLISAVCVGMPIEIWNLRTGYDIKGTKLFVDFMYVLAAFSGTWFLCYKLLNLFIIKNFVGFIVLGVASAFAILIVWSTIMLGNGDFRDMLKYGRTYIRSIR